MIAKEYYLKYALATGAELSRGVGFAAQPGVPGAVEMQRAHPGEAVIEIPEALANLDLEDVPEVLDPIRAALWLKAKTKRDAVIEGGALTPFGMVQSDEQSRLNINGAATAALIAKSAGQPLSIVWTMADNSEVTLTADQIIGMGMAVVTHVNNAHVHARTLRTALEAAETVTALLMIDVLAGWA